MRGQYSLDATLTSPLAKHELPKSEESMAEKRPLVCWPPEICNNDAMRCGTARHDTVRHSTVGFSVARYVCLG